MSEQTRKPCPFCGNANVTACQAGDDDRSWLVACDAKSRDCPMEVRIIECFSEEQAIAAWNRRAVPGEEAGETLDWWRCKCVICDQDLRASDATQMDDGSGAAHMSCKGYSDSVAVDFSGDI
jgi:hypothetical protein